MNFVLDAILILIFLLIVIISSCRGFVKSIWSMVTIVGAFVLAYMMGPTLGNWIAENYVYGYVAEYTYATVESIIEEKDGQYDVSELCDSLPVELVDLIDRCGADVDDIQLNFDSILSVSREELYVLSAQISEPIASTISMIIGFVTVFFAAIILISIIGLVLKLVVKVPIIRSVDSVLGAILGLVKGFVIVWVICLIIGLFVERGVISASTNDTFLLITNGSYLLRFFCNLSPIDFINIRF